jgi:predicted small lipoprotein YifL
MMRNLHANIMILRSLMRFSRLSIVVLAAAACIVSLTGCGSKGPLYLRDSPPPGTKLPKPPAPVPVPYPADPADTPDKKQD